MAVALQLIPEPADSVGGRIQQARRFANLTQRSLAKQAGISLKTMGSWESGATSPTIDGLFKISRATRFPVAWFIEGLDGNETDPGPDSDNRVTDGYPREGYEDNVIELRRAS